MKSATAGNFDSGQQRPSPGRRADFQGQVSIVCLVLGLHAGLLAWAALRDSPTVDEPTRVVGGLRRLLTGRFDADRGNPPLVGTVAAIPVLLAEPLTDWSSIPQPFAPGRDFMRVNGSRSPWLITLGRWACIPFSLVGAIFCFLWANALFGFRAGLLALLLWCFCPYMLGHGHVINTDVPASALGVAACYGFWAWLRQPSLKRAVLAGALLGLAELAKYVWVLLFVLWPVLWLLWRLLARRAGVKPQWRHDAFHLAIIAVLCLYTINVAYLFEGCFQPVSHSKIGQRVVNRLAGVPRLASALASLPVPLPRDYVGGIDAIDEFREKPGGVYLGGRSTQGTVWWFIPYAFSIKLPLGTLLILAAATVVSLVRRERLWEVHLPFWLPLAALFCFLTFSRVPQFPRYALPMLPLAYVWASQVASARSGSRLLRLLAGGGLAATVASSLFCYPHSLSYFNELVGGPRQGAQYLLDSEFDFGQDLLFLKRWLQAHPEARPLHLEHLFLVPPEWAGMEALRVPKATDPEGPMPGCHAISVARFYTGARGFDYDYFQQLQPSGSAGYTILIYHVTADKADQLRHYLGLPPLADSPESSRDRPAGPRAQTRRAP